MRNKPDSNISSVFAVLFMIIIALLPLLSFANDQGQSFRQRAHQKSLNVVTEEDIKAEINFGRDIAARVLGRFSLLKDPELNRYVSLIGTAVATYASRSELQYYFAVLDSDEINAYSAPGGYIFITHGALMQATDESELAAILAHEIAHITERHIVKALNIKAKDTSSGAGLGRLLGASTDTARVTFMQAIDQAIGILFDKGYKQEDELAADKIATLMLADSGYDPSALKRYLHRVQPIDRQHEAINTTHPPSQIRLEQLDRIIREEGFDTATLMKTSSRFKRYVRK